MTHLVNKDNLIIYLSSRNNYDMFGGEVLSNINTDGFELINVDDNSSEHEVIKGKSLCKNNNITFLQNKARGVQYATQTLIDFINNDRSECKWIVCFQHDIYPISTNFFTKLSSYIDSGVLDDVGVVGFNVLDKGDYTLDSYNEFMRGDQPLGMIGMAHLSIRSREGRWLCPRQQHSLIISNNRWHKPFYVEFPMWAAVAINVKLWNELITPTSDYHFHLWLPDIAMQFNYYNKGCVTIPDLYCLNDQALKEKYNINKNSATGAKNGDAYHFGEYSNFTAWKERWGWDYENVFGTYENVKHNYVGTLIDSFYNHKIQTGPLKNLE